MHHAIEHVYASPEAIAPLNLTSVTHDINQTDDAGAQVFAKQDRVVHPIGLLVQVGIGGIDNFREYDVDWAQQVRLNRIELFVAMQQVAPHCLQCFQHGLPPLIGPWVLQSSE